DSVAVCHVKVGNCQALKPEAQAKHLGFFLSCILGMSSVVLAYTCGLIMSPTCLSSLEIRYNHANLEKTDVNS
ncbi:MAG: hypothetical protein ABL903_19450, partial [Methylococcales bacterium]